MKIWLDFCEPKSITMLRPLYNELIKDHDVFITARDFDSTYYLLDEWGVDYYKVGKHGGGDLYGKLRSFSERLNGLIDVVEKEKPGYLFCITSPEAIRVAFGLQLPHVMFNDEPRSFGCSALTLPFVNKVIVPKPIPIEWYYEFGIKPEKIIRFNGIDEIGWLNPKVFQPDPSHLKQFGFQQNKYMVLRTEPTTAWYLMDKMKPHETLLTEIIPKLMQQYPEYQYLVIPRNQPQYDALSRKFEKEIASGNIILRKGVSNLAHIMYFAKMVMTGCGTMVRESSLMGVPSIEFFPLDTYPQEQFLIENGFPLKHVRKPDEVLGVINEYLQKDHRIDTKDKINHLENPLTIGLQIFHEYTNTQPIHRNK